MVAHRPRHLDRSRGWLSFFGGVYPSCFLTFRPRHLIASTACKYAPVTRLSTFEKPQERTEADIAGVALIERR
jgi:hypothetical protein